MAENSKIQWTTHTLNPWRGCTRVSEGCRFCYAETMSGRNPKTLGVWGPNGTRVVAAEAAWKDPLKWERWAKDGTCYHCHGWSRKNTPGKCEVCGGIGNIGPYRPRVFCASLADVFEDWTGPMMAPGKEPVYLGRDFRASSGQADRLTMDDVRTRLFALIDATPNLDWLLLSKRPENFARFLPEPLGVPAAPPNVWLGVSVEDQQRADERIQRLVATPAAVRFLSVEPMLGPVKLSDWFDSPVCYRRCGGVPHCPGCEPSIHWVICGGESGGGARPFDLAWARSLRDQCAAAGVPFFLKQLGAVVRARDGIDPLDQFPGSPRFMRQGPDEFSIEIGLLDRKGGSPEEWPADLRDCRAFPAPAGPRTP